MSSISIRKATSSDVPAMVAIDTACFQDTPFRQAMFPQDRRIKPGVQDQTDFFITQLHSATGDPNSGCIVAIDTAHDGQETIAGYALWMPPSPTPSKEKEERQEETNAAKATNDSNGRAKELERPQIPSCIDMDAVTRGNQAVSDLLEEAKPSFNGKSKETMWTLNAIGVDTKYRRKGIGQKLCQWGIDKAATAKQDIWLIATDSGRRLYDSVGFNMICEGERCGEPQFVMLKMYNE